MYRIVILAIVFILSTVPVFAKAADTAPATYILQVSSNLGCEKLNIELIAKRGGTSHFLTFDNTAFAAIDLPAGGYSYGDVNCTIKGNTQTFENLLSKISPLHLASGQGYFGGRLIFKKADDVDPNETPEQLSNCTREFSRARGEEKSHECRDGVGVKNMVTEQVSVFVPEVSDKDLETVRKALNTNREQLLYLPLKAS